MGGGFVGVVSPNQLDPAAFSVTAVCRRTAFGLAAKPTVLAAAPAGPRSALDSNVPSPLMSNFPIHDSFQGRAFALYSKAREGAGPVTAEDAIRQAQQASVCVCVASRHTTSFVWC